jgi:D-glycero-beta-D-manno-heptose 1-phosphate adenylyltransferase
MMSVEHAGRPPIPKLLVLEQAALLRESLHQQARKVVLTNGCFDLLHAGHIYFLQQAAECGDALFIALNSDASVRALKGPTRPLQSQWERAFALSALACTHTIVLFEQPRLVAEIETLRPDVYAKAGDYALETLDASERAALEAADTQIRFLPFLPGFSTTDLLKRIASAENSA